MAGNDLETKALGHNNIAATGTLDLSGWPPIFLSDTHLNTDELHELEEKLTEVNATLTYDLTEARIVLSKVVKKPRIQFDLRAHGVWTEEVKEEQHSSSDNVANEDVFAESPRASKRAKVDKTAEEPIVIDDSSTASESEQHSKSHSRQGKASTKKLAARTRSEDTLIKTPSPFLSKDRDLIRTIRLDWLTDSIDCGIPASLREYTTFLGRRISKPASATPTPKSGSPKTTSTPTKPTKPSPAKSVLERAREDAPLQAHTSQARPIGHFGKRKFGGKHSTTSLPVGQGGSWEPGHNTAKHPQLLHATTSSAENSSSSTDLPTPPDWVREGIKYACQRPTPLYSPNETFIGLLKEIRTARELTNDEIGVRAYSTSIASLAAYPYPLSSAREVLRLPGCESKIANLFVEWKNTGTLKAVKDIEANDDLQVLKLFFGIWGVGATTAREFLFERGWRDLDDIVEYGWSTLSRVQQIGVKFYDEFLDLIPRAEVEEIGRIVHAHAVKVRDDGIQSIIVGGYRRGKEASGDVDIVVSHPDELQTLNIVTDIVASLEEEGWITHTLLLSLNSTHRGQQTLPFRSGSAHGGHGFDTLDKALVVWQHPSFTPTEAGEGGQKNPNIHRRLDIIVSPWRTVGCAVAGWSGGTTFQRDLRRYAKNVKGWKFDSSGVRSRVNGEVVDLEGWSEYKGTIGEGRAKTMLEAERRVFEGMGLVWQRPEERCTG